MNERCLMNKREEMPQERAHPQVSFLIPLKGVVFNLIKYYTLEGKSKYTRFEVDMIIKWESITEDNLSC